MIIVTSLPTTLHGEYFGKRINTSFTKFVHLHVSVSEYLKVIYSKNKKLRTQILHLRHSLKKGTYKEQRILISYMLEIFGMNKHKKDQFSIQITDIV